MSKKVQVSEVDNSKYDFSIASMFTKDEVEEKLATIKANTNTKFECYDNKYMNLIHSCEDRIDQLTIQCKDLGTICKVLAIILGLTICGLVVYFTLG